MKGEKVFKASPETQEEIKNNFRLVQYFQHGHSRSSLLELQSEGGWALMS